MPWCMGISTFKQLSEALAAKDALRITNLSIHHLKVLDTHNGTRTPPSKPGEGVCSVSATWVLLGAGRVRSGGKLIFLHLTGTQAVTKNSASPPNPQLCVFMLARDVHKERNSYFHKYIS